MHINCGPRLRTVQLWQSISGLALSISLLAGCYGEDHWSHYKGGGLFVAGGPSISPNGSAIIYSTPSSGYGDIVRISPDGTGLVKLTDSDDVEFQPIYSPDGTKIVYARENDGVRHLWIMDEDGANHRQLTYGNVLDDIVDFSLDGSQILFDRSPASRGFGRFTEPYTIGIDGHHLQRRPAGVVARSTVSTDGNTCITSLYDDASKSRQIWVLDRNGANRRLLGKGSSPVYSRHGNMIFYLSEPYAQNLMSMNKDGTLVGVIPTLQGYKTPPRISENGKVLVLGVFHGERRTQDIVVLDAENYKIIKVIHD